MRNNFLLAILLAAPAGFTCSRGSSAAEHTAEVTTGGDARRGATAISR